MKKILKILCCMSIVLAVAMCNCIPAFAANNGIYIATATPHYKHPTTGTIEDSGGEGSAVLGQSMTESATYTKALVEVDSSGNTYVTVRLQLMDNIQNPKFKVDGKGNGSFSSVSASLMQEDYSNNTADYRMKVPSENAIIRCTMYVVPMGRDVVFYITISNLQSGSGDFITSIKVGETTKKSTTAKTSAQFQNTKNEETAKSQTTEINTTSNSSAENTSSAVDITNSTNAENAKAEETTNVGLQEFDSSGNEIGSEKLSEAENVNSSKVGWIIGGAVIVLAAGIIIWYFCFYKKKK